jgi:hypothetical protein
MFFVVTILLMTLIFVCGYWCGFNQGREVRNADVEGLFTEIRDEYTAVIEDQQEEIINLQRSLEATSALRRIKNNNPYLMPKEPKQWKEQR